MSAATASLPLTEDVLRGLGKDVPEHRLPSTELSPGTGNSDAGPETAKNDAAAIGALPHIGQAADQDDGYDSDATHASMPELIPLDPEPPRRPRHYVSSVANWPRIPTAAEAAAARKREAEAAAGGGGEEHEGSCDKRRKLGSRSQPEKRRAATFFTESDLSYGLPRTTPSFNNNNNNNNAAAPPTGPPPVSRWIGGYDERQEALAAFLDEFRSSSASDPPMKQPETPADLTPGPNSTDDLDLDDFLDGLEVSGADEAKAERLTALDPELADDASSDSTDVEDDDGLFQKPTNPKVDSSTKSVSQTASKKNDGGASTGKAASSKVKLVANHSTRVLRTLPPKQLPPGTPAAAGASRQVSQAVAAAAQTQSAPKPKGSGGKAADATCEAPSSNTNFGPRFQGLSSDQVQKARSSWTLHSLAETPRTSSAENQQAAFAFLQELRRRKEGIAASSGQKNDGAKPVFRRPQKRTAGEITTTMSVSASSSIIGGTFVSEECVVGTRRRVTSLGERAEASSSTASNMRGGPKKRRCVVSFGDDEDF